MATNDMTTVTRRKYPLIAVPRPKLGGALSANWSRIAARLEGPSVIAAMVFGSLALWTVIPLGVVWLVATLSGGRPQSMLLYSASRRDHRGDDRRRNGAGGAGAYLSARDRRRDAALPHSCLAAKSERQHGETVGDRAREHHDRLGASSGLRDGDLVPSVRPDDRASLMNYDRTRTERLVERVLCPAREAPPRLDSLSRES